MGVARFVFSARVFIFWGVKEKIECKYQKVRGVHASGARGQELL